MTQTAQTVRTELEVRKSKKQRAAFRALVSRFATEKGYSCHEEPGTLGATNLVVGDPETARVTYTAHYDTCARLPFPNFITPTNFGIYLLYQLGITLAILLLPLIPMFLVGLVMAALHVFDATAVWILQLIWYALLFTACYLIMAGPANPHTANDNTSGVVTLLELMASMPQELRGEVAFIFFDLEELGMLGSAGYYGAHKKAMKDRLLINFDCVSDGSTLLFAVRKGAASHAAAIEAAYSTSDTHEVRVMTKGVFYPSDQAQFPCGVGVAALKKTRRGLYYMDRIHTSRDTVFEEANIQALVEGSVRLARQLSPITDNSAVGGEGAGAIDHS